MTEKIFSTGEAARRLGMSERNARIWAERIGVPQVGGNYLWTEKWVKQVPEDRPTGRPPQRKKGGE